MSDALPDIPQAEKIARVIELIEGGSSENAACKEVGINRGTFRSAALKFGAANDYARATEALARDQVESIEAVIAEMREGRIEHQVARVELDARKWIASKLFPRQWGDKMALTGGGPDDAPIRTEAKLDVSNLTAEQLRALSSIEVK